MRGLHWLSSAPIATTVSRPGAIATARRALSHTWTKDVAKRKHANPRADRRLRQIEVRRRVDEAPGLDDLEERACNIDIHVSLSGQSVAV